MTDAMTSTMAVKPYMTEMQIRAMVYVDSPHSVKTEDKDRKDYSKLLATKQFLKHHQAHRKGDGGD